MYFDFQYSARPFSHHTKFKEAYEYDLQQWVYREINVHNELSRKFI